jgi:hypothetical protein
MVFNPPSGFSPRPFAFPIELENPSPRSKKTLTPIRHMFKSDKVAEVSYASKFCISFLKCMHLKYSAAIQGKDCLVQKFRNSSVMLEPEHYRPKVNKDPTSILCYLLVLNVSSCSKRFMINSVVLEKRNTSPSPTTHQSSNAAVRTLSMLVSLPFDTCL